MITEHEPLAISHCESVLKKPIEIASAKCKAGKRKSFAFIPWANEYTVFHDGKEFSGGQALEELIDDYNSL
jgi:hypothetical protein